MYSLRLLGGISLAGPSGPLSGRVVQQRQLAVLAALAMARENGCSRDKLVGYFWPETPGGRARHLLADSVYVLRKSLGDDAVITTGDMLRLNPDVIGADAVKFQESLGRGDLEAAVELYGGPFLEGFFGDGGPEFEHWVDAERRDLADRQASALESLAAGAEETGDYTQAAVWWRRLAAHDRYNSRLVLRLMQALVAAGDPANAIQQAQEHAAYLKKELELDPPAQLVAFVERLRREIAEGEHAHDAGISPAPATPRTPVRPVAEPITRRGHDRVLRRHLIARAGLAALAVLLVAVVTRQLTTDSATGAKRKSIAVLPFDNLTGDPANDYLAAGFHEEVIGQLAKMADVRVIARSSVSEYKDNPRNLAAIAEQLDVDNILEASVRSEGDRVRITVQLIDPRRNDHLWAENYDRERGDLLDVQLDVALRIAESLRAELTPEERARIERIPTQSQEAYDYYLRGVTFESNSEPEKAQQMYERAVEVDPQFALALARLSYVSSHLYGYYQDRTRDHLRISKEAVDRALALDPDLFEAHIARHYYLLAGFQDYELALEALDRAKELKPSDAEVYRRLGLVVRRIGNFQEGMEYLERALELSPRHRAVLQNAATTAIWLRDYPAAERFLDRGFDISPDDGGLFQWQALLYINMGDTARAWQAYGSWIDRTNSHVPDANTPFWRAVWRILHKNYREAVRQHTMSTMGGDPIEYYYLKALSFLTTGEERLARAYCDSGLIAREARLHDLPTDTSRLVRWAARGGFLPIFYAGLGRTADAVEYLTGDGELDDSRDLFQIAGHRNALAEVYAIGGDYDAAIDQLDYLLSMPSAVSVPQLELDPVWDPLRDHPRFQELLKRYGGQGGSE